MRPIERGRSRSELPAFRLLYDAAEEVLIIKLMPGAHHELANLMFARMFDHRLVSLGIADTLLPFGSTRYQAPSGRSKEADSAFKPSTRLPTDWPSLIIEVGVSESLPQLRTDTHYWLTQSGGQTKIVIIIAIKKATRVMTIERWEDRGSTQPTRQVRPPYNPIKMQALRLQANGQLSGGGSLLIPASKVFDTLPPGLGPNDFTFTGQDLAQYVQRYWAGVG